MPRPDSGQSEPLPSRGVHSTPRGESLLTPHGEAEARRPGCSTLLLTSFQPLTRVEQLRRHGVLVGSWNHVPGGWEPAYRTMTAAMAEAGIDCGGRPPMWAWSGPTTWGTAFLLLDELDLAQGWAAVTFRAPAGLVLLSDYDPWCDTLTTDTWRAPARPPGHDPAVVLQATLPRIEAGWVLGVTPLPTHGIFDLDWATPV